MFKIKWIFLYQTFYIVLTPMIAFKEIFLAIKNSLMRDFSKTSARSRIKPDWLILFSLFRTLYSCFSYFTEHRSATSTKSQTSLKILIRKKINIFSIWIEIYLPLLLCLCKLYIHLTKKNNGGKKESTDE